MIKDTTGSTGSLRTTPRRQFYVRAQFDYEPSRDSNLPRGPGLAFRTGDILCVINAADDSWWQAKRVIDGQETDEIGIIPSKSRWEKKERARQKRVNFKPGSNSRVCRHVSSRFIDISVRLSEQHFGSREEEKEKTWPFFENGR